MKCDKCKKGEMRQQVSIYADAPADCFNLSKKGIRSKRVQILGVGWDMATIYCNAGCGNVLFLRRDAEKRKGKVKF